MTPSQYIPTLRSAASNRLIREESGQDLIEYALLAALVGLSAVATMPNLSVQIADSFGVVSNTLTASTSSQQPQPPSDNHHDHGDHDH